MKRCVLAFILFSVSVIVAFGQLPPPNDNYSNRIVLSGTDLTFSGSLAGATVEDTNEAQIFSGGNYSASGATQSVWWTWAAPITTTLNLQLVGISLSYFGGPTTTEFTVYSASNGSTIPAGLSFPALAQQLVDFRAPLQTLSIPVTAGNAYQIQLAGVNSASYFVHLVATNTPVIIQQPRSQTVYSNASVLFYVVSAGINQTNFTFQWRFNGINIAGENAPMLALTNIDSSMAGAYSVIVSNRAGFTASLPATLSVSSSNTPIILTALGNTSNSFAFSFAGENGRNYRIQSSGNFSAWSNIAYFPIQPYIPNSTCVIFNSNSPVTLNVPNDLPQNFFRATPYVLNDSNSEICVNNLRKIRVAKLLWRRDADQSVSQAISATPLHAQLTPYFPHHQDPYCPYDSAQSLTTSYEPNNLLTAPTCQVYPAKHILEEPQ